MYRHACLGPAATLRGTSGDRVSDIVIIISSRPTNRLSRRLAIGIDRVGDQRSEIGDRLLDLASRRMEVRSKYK
jgi:hypothetical protein